MRGGGREVVDRRGDGKGGKWNGVGRWGFESTVGGEVVLG